MEERTIRHSSIHTVTFHGKRNSGQLKTSKKLSGTSSVVMQLADLRNKAYLEHLEEYYEELEKIMQTHSHRRVKSERLEFLVFIASQLTLTLLKYSILRDTASPQIAPLVQIFAILSAFSGIYFTSLHILNFGLLSFLQLYFCLDKLQLMLVSICFTHSLLIGRVPLAPSHRLSLLLFLPFWLFHSAATVRIQVMHYKWAKLEIIASKVVHLVSFLMVLTLAWQFVFYAKYRDIPAGYHAVLMHCAALALYFVEFYRLISKFDGTNDLRYEYEFENNGEVAIRKQKNRMKEKLEQYRFRK